jgi:hypothetical protein
MMACRRFNFTALARWHNRRQNKCKGHIMLNQFNL